MLYKIGLVEYHLEYLVGLCEDILWLHIDLIWEMIASKVDDELSLH